MTIGDFDIVSSSPKRSLNGEWLFCFDPENNGLKNRYYDLETDNSIWQKVSVPSTYNSGEYKNYQGKAWYKRQFTLFSIDIDNKQVVLRFLGAALRSRVWVNRKEVGSNKYGWIPFEIDISDAVIKGKNTVTVMTDNTILKKGIPDSNWNGWWYYGGIFRDVYLDSRPRCNIKKLYLETAQQDNGWRFSAKAEIFNSFEHFKIIKPKVKLIDNNNEVIYQKTQTVNLEPGSNLVAFQGNLQNIKEWSPDKPYLYRLVCDINSAGKHNMQINTAFREIKTQGSQIFLNSRPFKIRGINIHEEHPDYGNALPRTLIESTLDNMEKLNVNFVRTGHYTLHPYFYDICDRKGLLVWTEIPAWKTKTDSLSDPEIYDIYAAGQLKAMVQQYRKHPCIVVWSIGNEFKSDQPAARDYVKIAYSLVKSIDDTRLVTFASDRHRGKDSINGVSDLCYDIVDVVAINEYYGWYYGADEDIGPKIDEIHKLYPDKPIVVSELGAGAAPDGNIERQKYHSRKNYALDHQCQHLEAHLKQIYDPARENYSMGAMIWVWADFYDPHRIKSTHPTAWKGVNLKGLLGLDRNKKPSYRTVKDFYEAVSQSR
jgi:beta-glucuronidase